MLDTEKLQKIGILGGTFDPVHQGHLAVARMVLARYQLDTVLFIPAPSPPHKNRSITPFVHRVAMLEAALENDSELTVSILEAERTSPSFTVETLEELHQRLGRREYYLIMGADMFVEIELWYRYDDLLRLAHLIVVARPGVPFAVVSGQVAALPGGYSHDPVRQIWCREDGFQILYVPDAAIPISSSEVRERLRLGEPTDDLLPSPVLAYIAVHRLYGTSRHDRPEKNSHDSA